MVSLANASIPNNTYWINRFRIMKNKTLLDLRGSKVDTISLRCTGSQEHLTVKQIQRW